MTAQGEDLLAWLDKAISEREKTARAAEAISPSPWTAGPNEDESVAHIAANDPESVLRRCAADRKLIAAHPVNRDVINEKPDGMHGFGCFTCHNEDLLTIGYGWCASLRALAEGYGWTERER